MKAVNTIKIEENQYKKEFLELFIDLWKLEYVYQIRFIQELNHSLLLTQ